MAAMTPEQARQRLRGASVPPDITSYAGDLDAGTLHRLIDRLIATGGDGISAARAAGKASALSPPSAGAGFAAVEEAAGRLPG